MANVSQKKTNELITRYRKVFLKCNMLVTAGF